MDESTEPLARRRFLNFGLVAGCSCFFPAPLVAAPTGRKAGSDGAAALEL